MLTQLVSFFKSVQSNPLLIGLIGGIIITLFNALGSMVILFIKKDVSQKVMDTALGFAAGLMLAASFTSLIIPGIATGGLFPVIAGILLGTFFLDYVTHHVEHTHFFQKQKHNNKFTALWLFIVAITIHNIPEGLSVGIGLGSNHLGEAVALMIAIGIQNTPEGFSVAFSHYAQSKGSKWKSIWIGIASGLVEIPLTIIGVLLVSKIHGIMPYAMGFGAGAMLYVINNEIIPETHNKGFERVATIGTIMGIVLMLALDMGL